MKGIDSYESGTKETWRGWQWNRIVEHLCGFNRRMPPVSVRELLRKKTVIYLVGPDDKDREIAIKRGFLNENLIAIDIDQSRVCEVRSKKNLAIKAPLQQVLLNWPKGWKIDAVIADFCSGLNKDAIALVNCLVGCRGISSKTVVAVNMQRGRDKCSNDMRSLIKKYNLTGDSKIDAMAIHRGVQWLFYCASTFQMFCSTIRSGRVPDTGVFGEIELEGPVLAASISMMRPGIYSYKSTCGNVFDSVVCTWPLNIPEECHDAGIGRVNLEMSNIASKSNGVKSRLAALRAVRTKKLQSIGAA